MQNIKLSNEEYYQVIESVANLFNIGNGQTFLFGYPIYYVENCFLLYVACEYCGESAGIDNYKCCSKCGAPISNQGKRLTQRAPDTASPYEASESSILSKIINELSAM